MGTWELARAAPAPGLRPFVREYVGWMEDLARPICRRELPTDEAPLVLNFGAPFRLFAAGRDTSPTALGSFVAGAYDTYQLVESIGPSGGVQVNLTLLGIRLLVGRAIEDLGNRAVSAEDVLGPTVRDLTGRLYDAGTWSERFEVVDRAIAHRIAASASIPAGVVSTWHRLVATQGRASIRSIVQEIGWSQRHLIHRFRHEIGLSPKAFARVLRFGGVVRAIRAGRVQRLADLAQNYGYYDQSHLTRDCREFAGVTPSALLAELLPDGGGFSIGSPAAE
jgi:AraC-like DNA-binding protein